MPEAAQPERFTLQEYFTPPSQRRLRRFPHLLRVALAIVWSAAPRELALSALLHLGLAGGITAQLLVLRALLGELLAPGATPAFSALLPELVALAVLAALVAMAGAFLDAKQRVLGEVVALHASEQVIRTAAAVDLLTYDVPGFHDRLQRARLSAGTRPAQLVNGLLGVVGTSLAIAGILVALFVVEPLFSMLVLLAFVPVWLATNRAGRMVYRYSVEQTERQRLRVYLFDLLTGKDPAQEVRAFDLGDFLGRRHRQIYDTIIGELREVLRRRLRVALTGQLATTLLTSGALALLVWFITSGRMSIAEAGAAATAMVLLIGRLRGLAASSAGLYESSLYLEDYSSFVAARSPMQRSRPTAPAPVEPQLLQAQSVSFTYPSRKEPSVAGVSLELRRGEVVALVGENGSGKTTFAKLLGGLYAPQAGRILWDGADTAAFDPATVRARIVMIFQDFLRYQLSAHDNIAMGDPGRFDDVPAVERAARAAGIHDALAGLERGYETLLGPEFYGGSSLSGGQWQRTALARAFFRDAPIVILDEPTASLDARAEAALFGRMRELFAGRGVLLISHRFGSVRTADRIYVLRAGRVVESGSHAELVEKDGYYAELYRLQASQYAD